MTLRALEDGDGLLLRLATWLNLNWRADRFTLAHVDADPYLSAYHRQRPEFGVVSTADDLPSGVVWAIRFPPEAPGYGFVRAGVPELSICVLPGYRGAGLGTELLAAAVAQAHRHSVPALSLSVEEGNPARRLYERAGFVPAPGAADPGTLVLELAPG